MVNDTQIMCQNCSVGPLEGITDKIYLDKVGVYVNRQTSGINSNEYRSKLGYMSILEQTSVYATQPGRTELPVPTNPGATVTYPSGNVTAAVILATKTAHEEKFKYERSTPT